MPRITLTRLASTLVVAGLVFTPGAALAQSTSTSSPGVHVVQQGESLLQIALNAGVDVDALAALNGLSDPNALAVGQPLNLPTPKPAAPVAGGSYTVADGDNLWDIAQKLGTTTDVLEQLNNLDDPSALSLGMVLKVPAGGSSHASSPAGGASRAGGASAGGSASAPSQPTQKNVMLSYTVQPGQTLNQIARQFDVRADAIVQASSLSDANKIGSGVVLKVPVPAKQHTVVEGETLQDIAAAEKVDLGTLIDFNQIVDPGMIHVGQVVVVPVAATQQAAAVPAPAPLAATSTPTATATPAPSASATPKPTPSATPAASDIDVAASLGATTAASGASASAAVGTNTTSAASGTNAAAAGNGTSATSGTNVVTPKPSASATPKPVAPVAVVAPPPGAPTDGLAGAGLKLLGSPYVWGGSSPSGFDCSGFVWYLAKQLGKPLTRGMFGQYNSGSHPGRDNLQPGDLVFFQNTFGSGLSHNGVYIGNGQFVHAADEQAGVTISSLNTPYWSSHWFGATRLP